MAGCCPETALGNFVVPEDVPCKGKVEKLSNGMDAYVTGGPSKTAVIVAYDIFGFHAGRVKQICDTLAAEGHLVVLPDFYRGDNVEKGLSRGEEKMDWIKGQSAPGPLLDTFENVLLPYVESQGVERVAAMGWCWGTWFVVKAGGTGRIVAGVAPHPSHPKLAKFNGEEEDDVLAAVKCPLLLLPAGDDPESTKAGGANERVLKQQGFECKVQEFPDMKHGFISRGDINDPLIARDVQQAMSSAVSFLNEYLKLATPISSAAVDLKTFSPASRSSSTVDLKTCFSGKVVLVTGCSRGLGLGLVSHLIAAGAHVIATCRDPSKATELRALMAEGSCILQCDVSSEESIKDLVVEVSKKHDRLHMIFNNAGISSPNHPIDPILSASRAIITDVFQTNVLGTITTIQAFLPLLRAADEPKGTLCKTVVNMSSQLASIAGCFGCQGVMGDRASYRISRAANNMATRTFAGELSQEGFLIVSMSPGHVATDMGSAGGRTPPLTVDESVSGMLRVIASATPEKDNGKFLQYDGKDRKSVV